MTVKLLPNFLALIIFAITIGSIVNKRLYKNLEDKVFFKIVIIGVFTTIADIAMGLSYADLPVPESRLPLSYFFAYMYFILRQLNMPAYIAFIFAVSGTLYKVRGSARKYAFYTPYYLICFFILSNIVTGMLFTISPETGYSRGKLMPVLYIMSFLYSLFGFGYLCMVRKYFSIGRWMALISMYFLMVASAVAQLLSSHILVEMFAFSIALLIDHIFVQRPEAYFDHTVQLGTWTAYKERLYRTLLSKRKAILFTVRFENSYDVRRNYGEEKYLAFVAKKAAELKKIFYTKTKDFHMYHDTTGAIIVIFDQPYIDIERDFPEIFSMWTNNADDYTERFDIRMCSAKVPYDFDNVDDIVQFGQTFNNYNVNGKMFLRAEDVITTKDYELKSNLTEIISRGIQSHNFEMFYQPIFDLKEKKFRSAEALIRLKDPERGFISPGLFIPEAEKNNLILPIGDFVLDEVFKFTSGDDLSDLGVHYIELNLSVEQVIQKGLAAKITDLARKYGTSSDKINLEITESMSGVNTRIGFENINDLISRGYTFSLDDYGTGYSNIKRACDLPLSLIKIDKSLTDIIGSKKGDSIVSNTIKMMHDSGFKIVCEGVEHENQYKLLDEWGCDYIQGYYFAKPMCKTDYIEFLKTANA